MASKGVQIEKCAPWNTSLRKRVIGDDDALKIVALAKNGLTKEDVLYICSKSTVCLILIVNYAKRYVAHMPEVNRNIVLQMSPCTNEDLLLAIEDRDKEQFMFLYNYMMKNDKKPTFSQTEWLFHRCDNLGWYDMSKMFLKTLVKQHYVDISHYINEDNMIHYIDMLDGPMVIPTVPENDFYDDMEEDATNEENLDDSSDDDNSDAILSTILDFARTRIAQKRATISSPTPNETVSP